MPKCGTSRRADRWVAALVAMGGLWSVDVVHAAPILSYQFDTVNGTFDTPSTGTNTTAARLLAPDGAAADQRTADGGGVSGLAGDRAFDNSGSGAHGSSGNTTSNGRGRAYHTADNDAVDSLQSFTLTGWFNTASTPTNNLRIYHNSNQTGGFDLIADSGTLRIGVNQNPTAGGIPSRTGAYNTLNQWVFFAVTYDGSAGATNNVHFYYGTKTSSITDQSDSNLATDLGVTYNQGTAADETVPLSIGNQNVGTGTTYRPFDGLLDDMRIYGSKTDATGALTMTELEAVRLSAIPEPGTAALLTASAVGLLLRRRRRHS